VAELTIKLSVEELTCALTKCHGNIRKTADLLQRDYMSVYRYIKRNPEIAKIKDLLKEREIDYVEAELMKLIKAGDRTAIIFYLSTQGKERGWSKDIDKGKEVKPIVVKFVPCFGPNQGKEVPLNITSEINAATAAEAEEATIVEEPQKPKALKKKKLKLGTTLKKRVINVRVS